MDAAALIEAIRANPKEDAPRLMYSDWLSEFAEDNDQARATREFIQLSCVVGRVSNTMPMPAYEWLETNWQRLVPKTMSLHVPYRKGERIGIPGHMPVYADGSTKPPYKRAGRRVWCRINLQGKASTFIRRGDPARITVTPGRRYSCSVWFTFWKGFCYECEMYSRWGAGILFPVLEAECPMMKAEVVGL